MASISSRVSILTGSNSRRPSRVRLRIADDQPVHLGDRGFDEAERLGEILRELLVFAFEQRLDRRRRRPDQRRRSRRRGQRRDPLEDIAAQFLELAGEAHDVDQRRAQIVADDIGEALDFVVGLAQIGGALVDRGLEIEVVVAQLGFGVVARARRAPHQEDRNAGRARSPGRSRRRSRSRPVAGCGRRLWCAARTAALLPCASRRRCRRCAGRHRSASACAQHRDAAGGVVAAWRSRSSLSNSASRACDRRSQLLDVFDLSRVVAGQFGELVEVGKDAGGRGLVFVEKARLCGQQIAARRAFGAADLQQQGLIWFSTSTVCTTQALSLRDWLTRMTDSALIATSTKNPAASSRICPIARRRVASGVSSVSR